MTAKQTIWRQVQRTDVSVGQNIRVLAGFGVNDHHVIDGTLEVWGLHNISLWNMMSVREVVNIEDGLFAVFVPDHRERFDEVEAEQLADPSDRDDVAFPDTLLSGQDRLVEEADLHRLVAEGVDEDLIVDALCALPGTGPHTVGALTAKLSELQALDAADSSGEFA